MPSVPLSPSSWSLESYRNTSESLTSCSSIASSVARNRGVGGGEQLTAGTRRREASRRSDSNVCVNDSRSSFHPFVMIWSKIASRVFIQVPTSPGTAALPAHPDHALERDQHIRREYTKFCDSDRTSQMLSSGWSQLSVNQSSTPHSFVQEFHEMPAPYLLNR